MVITKTKIVQAFESHRSSDVHRSVTMTHSLTYALDKTMLLIGIIFLQIAMATGGSDNEPDSSHDCLLPDNRDSVLKKRINCGNNQCFCTGTSAHCVGDEFTNKLPPLDDVITELYAQCYNLNNVNASTFAEVSKNLEIIYLDKSRIQFTSRDMLRDFDKLRDFRISDNNAINTSTLGEALGSVRGLKNVTLFKIELTKLTGDLFARLNATNIEFIDLSGNRLQVINASLFNRFTSLRYLNLSDNFLKEINPGDAMPFLSLEHLDLRNNRLTADSFQFCSNSTPGMTLFPFLKVLFLQYNSIATQIGDWSCVPNLTELYIDFNRLKQVNISTFASLKSLRRLSLVANWISIIEPGTFPPKLESLDFRENEIAIFPPKLCADSNETWSNNLRYLFLRRNYIKKIMIDNWTCLDKLEYLDLSKNDVDQFRNDTFLPLVSLTHLYLDNMMPFVTLIEPRAFKTAKGTLEVLTLRHDGIDFRKEAMQGIFKSCPTVTDLDISYNYFKGVTEEVIVNILSPMKKLQRLRAAYIYLQKFPSLFLKTFKALSYLDVDRNHLNNIEFPEEFNDENLNISLKVLHVARCSINTVERDAFPVAIRKSLRSLDISNNEFQCGCKLTWFRDVVTDDGLLFDIELLRWPNEYECRSPRGEVGNLVKDFRPEEICSVLEIIAIAVAAPLVFFGSIVALCYWKYWTLKYWWYRLLRMRCRKECRHEDSERRPLLNRIRYDGFVIHDSDDDEFVHHKFLDVMEKKFNYKLHIWKRDATNGSMIDVILDGMEDSRQIIVIVSNKLTKNQWCKFQVDVAMDRSYRLNKNNVLLVVLEDTNFKYVSKAWCVLFAKTPKAFWCNNDVTNDIRWKLFEQTIMLQFGTPLSERSANSIQ